MQPQQKTKKKSYKASYLQTGFCVVPNNRSGTKLEGDPLYMLASMSEKFSIWKTPFWRDTLRETYTRKETQHKLKNETKDFIGNRFTWKETDHLLPYGYLRLLYGSSSYDKRHTGDSYPSKVTFKSMEILQRITENWTKLLNVKLCR